MMDLERVLPAGVQVTSIEPVITAEGDVNTSACTSPAARPGVDLVRNLERQPALFSLLGWSMKHRRPRSRTA